MSELCLLVSTSLGLVVIGLSACFGLDCFIYPYLNNNIISITHNLVCKKIYKNVSIGVSINDIIYDNINDNIYDNINNNINDNIEEKQPLITS